jgi:hypothetical protein
VVVRGGVVAFMSDLLGYRDVVGSVVALSCADIASSCDL